MGIYENAMDKLIRSSVKELGAKRVIRDGIEYLETPLRCDICEHYQSGPFGNSCCFREDSGSDIFRVDRGKNLGYRCYRSIPVDEFIEEIFDTIAIDPKTGQIIEI